MFSFFFFLLMMALVSIIVSLCVGAIRRKKKVLLWVKSTVQKARAEAAKRPKQKIEFKTPFFFYRDEERESEGSLKAAKERMKLCDFAGRVYIIEASERTEGRTDGRPGGRALSYGSSFFFLVERRLPLFSPYLHSQCAHIQTAQVARERVHTHTHT